MTDAIPLNLKQVLVKQDKLHLVRPTGHVSAQCQTAFAAGSSFRI
jgi:hypothetical protein